MVIDYSERHQSQRLQPKKGSRPSRPSVWPYLLLIFVIVSVAFVAGVGTGWYLFRPGGKLYKQVPVPQPAQQKAPETPAVSKEQQGNQQTQPQTPLNTLPPAEKGATAPLTFYNTLQKGNKNLMGTGINSAKEPQPANPTPPAQSTPER